MLEEIYAHFHSDERQFIDKAEEWVEKTAASHIPKLTDFMDPRQCRILEMLAERNDQVHVRLDGGYANAERCRVIIAPHYRDLQQEDARIEVLSIFSADEKLQSLDHGDYMGSILGLGIKREKIGDIQVIPGGCHCLAAAEIIEFLHMHLQQVHRVHVQTEILPLSKLEISHAVLEEMQVTVASLRLDAIVSEVHRLSRAKSLIPIKAGKCRVNWRTEEDPSKQLKSGDMISLQGYGRFKLCNIDGTTKKGKIRITIGKYV